MPIFSGKFSFSAVILLFIPKTRMPVHQKALMFVNIVFINLNYP